MSVTIFICGYRVRCGARRCEHLARLVLRYADGAGRPEGTRAVLLAHPGACRERACRGGDGLRRPGITTSREVSMLLIQPIQDKIRRRDQFPKTIRPIKQLRVKDFFARLRIGSLSDRLERG